MLHCWHCRVATDDFDSSSAGWALMTVRIGPFSQCCKFLKLFACSYLPNQPLQKRTDGPTSSCKVQGSSATSELRPKFRKTELRRQGRAAAQTRGRDGRSESEHLLRAMVASRSRGRRRDGVAASNGPSCGPTAATGNQQLPLSGASAAVLLPWRPRSSGMQCQFAAQTKNTTFPRLPP